MDSKFRVYAADDKEEPKEEPKEYPKTESGEVDDGMGSENPPADVSTPDNPTPPGDASDANQPEAGQDTLSSEFESPLTDSFSNSNFKNMAEFPSLHYAAKMADLRAAGKQMDINFIEGCDLLNGALDSLMVDQLESQQSMQDAMPLTEEDSSMDLLFGLQLR